MVVESKYNIRINRDNKIYLWNTLSGNLISVREEKLNEIQQGYIQLDSLFAKKMFEYGFVVDDNFDETGFVLLKERQMQYADDIESFYVTVATTLNCNYRCNYCFEKNVLCDLKMTKEVQKKTVNYIIGMIKGNRLCKKFRITWFGGEPLLYPEIIKNISEPIIEYCDANSIDYGATVITNASLLTQDVFTILKQCKVSRLQITIDGSKEMYCKQKGVDASLYDKVIDNIINIAGNINISIRINYLPGMEESIYELTEFLLKDCCLNGKIKIYLAQVRSYDDLEHEKQINAKFLEFNNEFIKCMQCEFGKTSISDKHPVRTNSFCQLACKLGGCIGPKGELYRCEHALGHSELEVGNVGSGLFYNAVDAKYLDVQHDAKCFDCKMFPICLGGCKNDIVNKTTAINCDAYVRASAERILDYTLSKGQN